MSYRTAPLVFLCLLLSACGFQPLYGSRGSDRIVASLISIQVAPAKDRVGQILTNELKHLLNPLREPPNPHYRLTTKLSQTTASLAVKKTSLATRSNLTVNVKHKLISVQSHQTLTSGANSMTVSYNIYDSEFATLTAEKDAQKRALKELAHDIRLQLGVYFNKPPAQPASR